MIYQTKKALEIEFNNSEEYYNSLVNFNETYSIQSNANGKLLKSFLEVGMNLKPNMKLAYIGNSDSLFIRSYIDSRSASSLKLGDKLKAIGKIFGDMEVELTIEKIKSKTANNDNIKLIECYLDSKPSTLIRSEIEFDNIFDKDFDIKFRKESNRKVLSIPKDFIFSRDSVYLLDGSDKIAKKIKVGIEGEKYVQVLNGLKSSDKLIK